MVEAPSKDAYMKSLWKFLISRKNKPRHEFAPKEMSQHGREGWVQVQPVSYYWDVESGGGSEQMELRTMKTVGPQQYRSPCICKDQGRQHRHLGSYGGW